MNTFALADPTRLDHAWFVLLAIALPLYSWWSYPKLRAQLSGGQAGARLAAYNETIAILSVMAAVTLAIWWAQGRSWQALGLVHTVGPAFLSGAALTAAALAYLAWQVRVVARTPAHREEVRAQIAALDVTDLLPHTDAESRRFRWVSLAAGVGEELAYRGFLIAYCAGFAGTWGAMLLSSAVFGIAHAYQGRAGVLRTGLTGLVSALLYVATGSLWLPIVLHIAVDLNGGAMGRLALEEAKGTVGPVENAGAKLSE